MGRFLFFVEGLSSIDRRQLAQAHLLDRFVDEADDLLEFVQLIVSNGPLGRPGLVIARGVIDNAEDAVLHQPHGEKWMKGKDGKFYLAIEPAGHFHHHPRTGKGLAAVDGEKPGPADLIRPAEALPTLDAILADGNAWKVADLAAWGTVRAAELEGRIAKALDTGHPIPPLDAETLAAAVFNATYLIGAEECQLLSLFAGDAAAAVLQAACRLPDPPAIADARE